MSEIVERIRIALAASLIRLAIRVHPSVVRRSLQLFVSHVKRPTGGTT